MTADTVRSLVSSLFAFGALVLAVSVGAEPTPEATPTVGPPVPALPLGTVLYTLGLSAQLRLRGEADDDLDLSGYRPEARDTFILSRLTLDLDASAPTLPRLYLQLRDARAFGATLEDSDFPRSNPIHDPLDVREALVEWRRIGGSPLGFSVGRQRIAYGDERVFGPGEWGNTGRWTWDAARAHLEHGGVWADAWIGRAVVNRPDRWPNSSRDGVRAAVLYGGLRRGTNRFDLFVGEKRDESVLHGEHGSGPLRCQFAGFQTDLSLGGPWRAGATWVKEGGERGGDPIEAHGTSAWLSVRLPGEWKPTLTGSSTRGSGDRDPYDGRHGTFDGVFGGADIRFYGYLNLVFWANVEDHEARLELEPARGLAVRLEGHIFRLDEARDAWYSTGLQPVRRDPSGAAGRDLGWELDARGTWSPAPRWELGGGGGWFVPGSMVRRTGPSPKAWWSFLQVTRRW